MFCAIYMPFEVWPNIMRIGTLMTTTNSWSKNIHFLHSDLYNSFFKSERKISQSTTYIFKCKTNSSSNVLLLYLLSNKYLTRAFPPITLLLGFSVWILSHFMGH